MPDRLTSTCTHPPAFPRNSISQYLERHSYPKAFLSAIQPSSHQAAPAERRKKKERRKVRKVSWELHGDPAAAVHHPRPWVKGTMSRPRCALQDGAHLQGGTHPEAPPALPTGGFGWGAHSESSAARGTCMEWDSGQQQEGTWPSLARSGGGTVSQRQMPPGEPTCKATIVPIQILLNHLY